MPRNEVEHDHHDVEMDFFDHLEELRRRLVRIVVWLTLGVIVSWYLVPLIAYVLAWPIGGKMQFTWRNLYDPFTLYVKVSLISGIITFSPMIIYEIWAFIAPALTREEKKFVWFSFPFSVLLFFGGVALCYVCIPLFLMFFLPFFNVLGPDSKALIDGGAYVTFMLLCFLAFGACFQVPLIVVFLAKLGLVDYKLLSKYRKHAYFVIALVVSIVAPTWDPMSLIALTIPVCLLYEMSVWIVRYLVIPINRD